LHAPTNIAGIAGLLAQAQRDLGFDATSVQYVANNYDFATDRTLSLSREDPLLKKMASTGSFALEAIKDFDIFHLYFGNTLFPYPYPDLPVLRALGKKVIFHFCGCDVRDRDLNMRKYYISGCSECVSLVCLGKHHPNPAWSDVTLVSTPDLLEFVPGALLMPGPIDLSKWQPRPPRTTPVSHSDPVRILHAPSDREIKGTPHILAAIERLKSAGYPIELLLLEGIPHDQVAEFCNTADIAVDQIMMGAYGTVSIEMMAKGVPVICRIRDDLRPYYPADLPLITAEPYPDPHHPTAGTSNQIHAVLENLLQHPETWPDLGARGTAYVRHEHEMHAVARRVLSLYGL
jgi:glycosyltransferase involved in cell wall biosynthesis